MVVLQTPLVTLAKKEEDLKLVKFCDIKEWYSFEEDIDVEFILDSKLKGSTLDWIGLFREDWNTFESFITFQGGLGKPVSIDSPRRRRVTFASSRQISVSLLLDFKYQFVYIDRYLDILGMSPLFRFTLPLKSLVKESRSLPVIQPLTLSEELLLSEVVAGGKPYLTSCRFHRQQLNRNSITTCSHCRPCGHDYFSIKDKAEMSFMECTRLSQRVTTLEAEVASNTMKLRDVANRLKEPIEDSSDNLRNSLIAESKIKFSESDTDNNMWPLSMQCLGAEEWVEADGGEGNENAEETTPGEVKTRPDIVRKSRKETTRSSSFPQDTWQSKIDLYTNNHKGARKCFSDGKLANKSECLALSDVESPLILKAIIGHQEQRIRRLTRLLNQENIAVEEESQGLGAEQEVARCFERDENVVRLVRTEQRMLAQILRINSNSEEFSNQEELAQKGKM